MKMMLLLGDHIYATKCLKADVFPCQYTLSPKGKMSGFAEYVNVASDKSVYLWCSCMSFWLAGGFSLIQECVGGALW